jgi:2-polyprenyl-6-methoxyphenol hydroxylase-like FAD-dependent oxidoreductase
MNESPLCSASLTFCKLARPLFVDNQADNNVGVQRNPPPTECACDACERGIEAPGGERPFTHASGFTPPIATATRIPHLICGIASKAPHPTYSDASRSLLMEKAMAALLGKQAIVIGAGMGGLAAAGAAADYFEHVIVLERDSLPSRALPRAGTPQAQHTHALLGGGQLALEALFPGFTAALAQAGAVTYRVGLEILAELPGFDPFPQRDLGWDAHSMSRPLIEQVVRQLLMKRPNVEIRERCRVDHIVMADTNGGAVSAVRLADRDGAGGLLAADLVIDSSGRGALSLAALRATDHAVPAETSVGIDMAYATGIFSIPDDAPRQWKGVYTFPSAPRGKRGALMLPIEGNRWIVSLAGAHGDAPPGDLNGFLAFAGEMRTQTIYNALKNANPASEVLRFAFPESVWRHFERLHSFPRGLLPFGDVICRFNPIFGQGMTVAAKEACVLRDIFAARAGDRDPFEGLAQTFFAAIQEVLDTPWATAAIADFVYPETRGDRPADLENTLKFGQAMVVLAARDAEVHKLRLEVMNLLKPRSVYRNPDLVARVRAVMAEA